MSQGALGSVLQDGVAGAGAGAATAACGADHAAPELPALRRRSVTFAAAGGPDAEAVGVASSVQNIDGERCQQ